MRDEATIVTFYSYKGGVGRSMALANVAWILAEQFHRRVLTIDWDLEAPGLHRFFDLEDSEISGGLIELLDDYKALLQKETKLPEKLVDVPTYISKRYIREVRRFTGDGSISILPAGQQTKEYSDKVNKFSWEEFYATWHGFGFIEDLKKELKTSGKFDIILVDSRTGVTDIGGICTLQLPDIVVLLFALNEQNIKGIQLVANRITQKALEIDSREQPPTLIIRPARVERLSGNQKTKVRWQRVAALELKDYFEGDSAESVIARKNIPYVSDFSYGETPLAVEVDRLSDIVESFTDLANSIIDASETLNEQDQSKRRRSHWPWNRLRQLQLLLLSRKKNRYIFVLAVTAVLALEISGLLAISLQRSKIQIATTGAQQRQLEADLARLRTELAQAQQEQLFEQEVAQLKQIRDALPSNKRRQAVTIALDLLDRHIPFVMGGRRPESGFDLSGFIDYILSQPSINIVKTPTLCNQDCLMNKSGITPGTTLDDLRPGDLIFYEYEQTMMYVGNDRCLGMIYQETIEIKDVRSAKIIGYGKVPYGD
jgi:MinD-like ATPase involved in chromosome partitioning or flagellar assembly